MSDPFIAEIVMFGGNFAPRSWAFCDGQLLAINSNTALFSLVGTVYGGDGRTTFALPDMRGRAVIGPRSGPGLTPRTVGQKGGTEYNTQTIATMAAHTHDGTIQIAIPTETGGTKGTTATGSQFADTASADMYSSGGSPGRPMAANGYNFSTGSNGQQQQENNMQPWIAVNYIIALQGIFPSRS